MDPRAFSCSRFFKNVKVTNDVAERGCHMITEYATILCKDDGMKQQLLQGVEKHRKLYPDMNKNTLNKKI